MLALMSQCNLNVICVMLVITLVASGTTQKTKVTSLVTKKLLRVSPDKLTTKSTATVIVTKSLQVNYEEKLLKIKTKMENVENLSQINFQAFNYKIEVFLSQQVNIISEIKKVKMTTPRAETATTEAATKSCFDLESTLNITTINGKRYYISDIVELATWYEADHFCRSQGMQLISVDTRQEWIALKSKFEYFVERWSSGFYYFEEAKWKWTTTDSVVTFFNLKPRLDALPAVKFELCLVLSQEMWVPSNCLHPHHFICKVSSLC